MQDYLETISELIDVNGHAHTKDIAEKLQVKMPSVSNALQNLAHQGYIRYRRHTPVTLTALGAEMAAVLRHRHNGLKLFFQELLKLNEEEADHVACRIEHEVGEKVISRFVTLVQAVRDREDCASLREYLAQTMPVINTDEEETEELISLDQLPLGKRGIVVRVAENLRGMKKFADLGLVTGTLLQMEGHAPFGDLLRVRIMDSSLSLRSSDAAHIWLKLTE